MNEIGIAVGLYSDYGPAQQLYFQLGKIYTEHPDSENSLIPFIQNWLFFMAAMEIFASRKPSKF